MTKYIVKSFLVLFLVCGDQLEKFFFFFVLEILSYQVCLRTRVSERVGDPVIHVFVNRERSA